jgi:hypothetical protein
VRISVEELAKRITFTRRKFKGFITETTENGCMITVNAPIIDDGESVSVSTTRRPESWNAKMPLNGRLLITDEQFERLLANTPPKSPEKMKHHDPIPVVKIFLPHIRWLLVWGYPDNLDRFFCVAQFGTKEPKPGDVYFSDIVKARLGEFVQPERALHIKLDKPWSHYLSKDSDW